MTFGLKQGDKFAFHPKMDPETYLMDQLWEEYTPVQHELFNTLCQHQMQIMPGRAYDEYIDFIKQMGFDEPTGIPKFEEINKKLHKATGWKIAAVPGLLPNDVFFGHLANRVFPVTFWLRDPDVAEYLPEPDLFHDLFGHVPMLMNPFIADYMQAYGKGGLKASKIEEGLIKITRLYWYTIEFGLINTADGIRIYGAGILSSEAESKYAVESPRPHRLKFDIRRIMQTDYRYFDLQDTYFVIDSFEQLVEQTKGDFTPHYADLLHHPVIDPVNLMIGDRVITSGTVGEE
jgi:phenylalanine-4-hydroxylase